jgi:hypothetical protein
MGVDERRYPFMDEGWTTAFEYLFNLEDIGKEAADAVFIAARSGNLAAPYVGEEIPIIMPADATRGMVTGKDGYEKPALAYLALKEYMGDEAFKTSLHAFIERWHGKRPLKPILWCRSRTAECLRPSAMRRESMPPASSTFRSGRRGSRWPSAER